VLSTGWRNEVSNQHCCLARRCDGRMLHDDVEWRGSLMLIGLRIEGDSSRLVLALMCGAFALFALVIGGQPGHRNVVTDDG